MDKYRIKRGVLLFVDDHAWWCIGAAFVLGLIAGLML